MKTENEDDYEAFRDQWKLVSEWRSEGLKILIVKYSW